MAAEVIPVKRPNPSLVQQCLTSVAEKAKRRRTEGCAICFRDFGTGKQLTRCGNCGAKWHTDCATIFRELKCVNCGSVELEDDEVKYFRCQICQEDVASSGGYEAFLENHFKKCLERKTLAEISKPGLI